MEKRSLFPLRLDKWDSYFFKTPIARLTISGRCKYPAFNEQIRRFIEKTKATGVGYAVIKLVAPRPSYEEALLMLGMRKCGESIDLVCRHPKMAGEKPFDGCKVRCFEKQDQRMVGQIAKDAFRHSYLYKCGFAERSQVDRYHSMWIENLSKESRCHIFVAERSGRVIGFVALNTNEPGKNARIVLIAIHKKYRGRGYGSVMIKACLGWPFLKNRSIYVKTQIDNKQPLALYKKMGFEPISREKIFFKKIR